jgi:aconitate decarboxylase
MTSLTRAIADYAVCRGEVPARIADIVKLGFIDCVACIVAARHDDVVVSLRRFVESQGRGGSARAHALTDGTTVAAADAAMINATAAHVLDYDDVAMAGHPSAVLVPAILAAAQSTPGCSGADAVRAYVTGYEVWAELYRRDADALHQKGWHPSSTLGLIAATAAVISISGIEREQAQHALGIACSRAGGVTANFGSGTKPLHIGHAASEAIIAVALARCGITAAPDALEHHSGLLHALSPRGNVDVKSEPNLSHDGAYLSKYGLSLKRYPVCYASHRVLDGILALREDPDFELSRVQEITLHIGDTQANMLRVEVPQTTLQSKFALKFCVAAAAVQGRLGMAELDPASMQHPDVVQLFKRIRVITDDAKCEIYPWFSPADTVIVRLDAGKTLSSGPIPFAKGNAHNPITATELKGKYEDCMAGQDTLATAALYEHLSRIQDVPDLDQALAPCIRNPHMAMAGAPDR